MGSAKHSPVPWAALPQPPPLQLFFLPRPGQAPGPPPSLSSTWILDAIFQPVGDTSGQEQVPSVCGPWSLALLSSASSASCCPPTARPGLHLLGTESLSTSSVSKGPDWRSSGKKYPSGATTEVRGWCGRGQQGGGVQAWTSKRVGKDPEGFPPPPLGTSPSLMPKHRGS